MSSIKSPRDYRFIDQVDAAIAKYLLPYDLSTKEQDRITKELRTDLILLIEDNLTGSPTNVKTTNPNPPKRS